MTSWRSAIQEPCSEYWNMYFWDKHKVFREQCFTRHTFLISSLVFMTLYQMLGLFGIECGCVRMRG
jgi:hypothetical protein